METEVVVVSKTLRPLSFAHPDAVGNCRPPIDQNVATIYGRLCYLPSSATSLMKVPNWFVHDKIQFLLKEAIQQVFKMHREHVRLSPLAASYSPASVSDQLAPALAARPRVSSDSTPIRWLNRYYGRTQAHRGPIEACRLR